MIWMEKKSEQVWRKSPLDMNFTDGAAVTLSSQDKRDHHPLREVDGDTLRFRCALIQLLNRRMSRVSCCCCCCCSFFSIFSIFCFFCFLFLRRPSNYLSLFKAYLYTILSFIGTLLFLFSFFNKQTQNTKQTNTNRS